MPNRPLIPKPEIIEALLDAMPGTVAELSERIGYKTRWTWAYINTMHKVSCHISGYQCIKDGKVLRCPANIYDRGVKEDAQYIRYSETAEGKAAKKAQQAIYRDKMRKHSVAQQEDLHTTADDDSNWDGFRRTQLAIRANNQVHWALRKQNTPFKPLFDLMGQ